MAQQTTLKVRGYREFLRAVASMDKETKKEVRAAFRQAAQAVRVDATRRFSEYDERSAKGYRIIVRQRGVAVEQRYRKTTGKHPEFGPLQMRKALLPAAVAKAKVVEREMERALDRVAAHFERIERIV